LQEHLLLRRNNIEVDFIQKPIFPRHRGRHQLIQVILNLCHQRRTGHPEVRETAVFQIRAGRNGKQTFDHRSRRRRLYPPRSAPRISIPFTMHKVRRGTGLGSAFACPSFANTRKHRSRSILRGAARPSPSISRRGRQHPESLFRPFGSRVASFWQRFRPAADLLRAALTRSRDEESLRNALQKASLPGLARGLCRDHRVRLSRISGRLHYERVSLRPASLLRRLHGGRPRRCEAASSRPGSAKTDGHLLLTGGFFCLVESSQVSAGAAQPVCLQKPFRISDVLALLKVVLSDAPRKRVLRHDSLGRSRRRQDLLDLMSCNDPRFQG